MEKIVWKKCENTFFINTWILWQKMGEKRGKKFFQKHTAFASKQRWKKIVWKKCENTFFINTGISWPKNGGKKREKKFSRNTRISRIINDGKKSSGKSAKTRFFYKHTNIRTKKWGEKTREKSFPETHVYRELKTM